MPELKQVYSESVDSIGWENGELHVRWKRTGRVSVYRGVPSELAENVMNAASVGQALRNSIQGIFEHSYI